MIPMWIECILTALSGLFIAAVVVFLGRAMLRFLIDEVLEPEDKEKAD